MNLGRASVSSSPISGLPPKPGAGLVMPGIATTSQSAVAARARPLVAPATALGTQTITLLRWRPVSRADGMASSSQTSAAQRIRALVPAGATAISGQGAAIARWRALSIRGAAASTQAAFPLGYISGAPHAIVIPATAVSVQSMRLSAVRGVTAPGSATSSQSVRAGRSRPLAFQGSAEGIASARQQRRRPLGELISVADTDQASIAFRSRALGALRGTATTFESVTAAASRRLVAHGYAISRQPPFRLDAWRDLRSLTGTAITAEGARLGASRPLFIAGDAASSQSVTARYFSDISTMVIPPERSVTVGYTAGRLAFPASKNPSDTSHWQMVFAFQTLTGVPAVNVIPNPASAEPLVLVGRALLDPAHHAVIFQVTGGSDGSVWTIEVNVATTDGDLLQREVLLSVRDQ